MTNWNFADVWELVAAARPDAPALVQGSRRRSWREFEDRADRLGYGLAKLGARPSGKVAQLLYNGPEYLESVFASFKQSLVPVNTNYRYTPAELAYLWSDADVRAVVFHGSFTERLEVVRREELPIETWVWVDDATGPCPSWATPYESLATGSREDINSSRRRSGDDITLLYTGGTTGMPKGVVWRQDDLLAVLSRSVRRLAFVEDGDRAEFAEYISADTRSPRALVLPPLMHGTALFGLFTVLVTGGCGVFLAGRSFNAAEALDAAERERVDRVMIVGDAMAAPLAHEWRMGRSRDLSSLRTFITSGVQCSTKVKTDLVAAGGGLIAVLDSLGSSEAIGIASAVHDHAASEVSASTETSQTSAFRLNVSARVLDEQGQPVLPGSGVIGKLAIKGRGPLGYYRAGPHDHETFATIDGERWVIPGDFASLEADGTVRFLGRGSSSINTGGEKVFPEEVEDALRNHCGVVDAGVVSLPHYQFGEIVSALIELDPRSPPTDETATSIMTSLRARLASYKVPRIVVITSQIPRYQNGKMDHDGVRSAILAEVGASSDAVLLNLTSSLGRPS
jgi:3-oxocholest-4-en-26-oate---CoA ligase